MRFFKIFLAIWAFLPLVSQAQVNASLVAADDSVQAGTPFTAAVRLEHEPHWHTYWLNAGTGYPTTLEWDLPAGWTAGDIQWPTPVKIVDASGMVTGNGYEGVLYLPVTLTPPADLAAGEVSLRVTAKWLMCAEVCIPGSQDLALTLPVSADPPMPNAAVRAELQKMPMPRSAPDFGVVASRSGDTVTLQLTGTGTTAAPHFFSEDAFIQYDEPQQADAAGGALQLTMSVAEDAEAGTQNLLGIFAYTDEQGVYRGVNLEVPFSDGAALAGGMADGAASAAAAGGQVAGTTTASLMLTLLFAVIGGLILNLMPCVFPVLGIKIVGFVNQAGNDRRKVTMHGLTFTAGVVLSFWALAAVLAVLRTGGEELGWGFQLQSPVFVYALAVVMLVFALSLSGVFEFGLRATGVGSNLQMKEGYAGSFFTGVLATVVATPCSAPFLAPALGAAFALSTAQSFLVFTAIALGLSLPYLLLSVFPQAIKFLPRPGKWMETFKQVMAFPLYATVGYLIWVLAGQTSDNGLLAALIGLTVIAMAAWMYGRYRAPGNSVGRARFGLVGGLALFAIGANLGWPRAMAPTDVVWEPWTTARIAQLREEGRPIYVDFTARWCATCQANKKVVFASEEVKRYFREEQVVALKADWTNADPLITAELAKWNRSAIPFNLVYRSGEEPLPLPEILTPGIVLNAFRGAGEDAGARQAALTGS
jgi:thiol:disulfide interchange protein DsbD